MYLNNFSVRIIGGNEAESGYVEMRHGQVYKLSLRNSRVVNCDARVTIDGKDVGTWRIPSLSSIVLARPVHDDGQFTFYKVGTREARQAQLDEYSGELGLIEVVFTPELVEPVVYKEYSYQNQWTNTGGLEMGACAPIVAAAGGGSQSRSEKSLSAGGTGLSGQSNQKFGTTYKIDYDLSQRTTIYLRLVARDDGPRPLTAHSNPIPPRI